MTCLKFSEEKIREAVANNRTLDCRDAGKGFKSSVPVLKKFPSAPPKQQPSMTKEPCKRKSPQKKAEEDAEAGVPVVMAPPKGEESIDAPAPPIEERPDPLDIDDDDDDDDIVEPDENDPEIQNDPEV